MVIFSIIFPLMLMVSLGFLATRFKFLNREHIAGISKFTFNLCLPVFLFLNMFRAQLENSLNADALMVFYIPVLTIFSLGFICNKLMAKNKHKNNAASAVYALSCSYSNTILVGLPVVISAIGAHMMGSVFVIITFHSALLFALTFCLAQINGKRFNWRHFIRSVLLNPVVLSISLGLIFNAISVKLAPQVIAGLELLSQPALAGALFVLGANLSFYKITGDWHLPAVASALKLLLLPALVYLLGRYGLKLQPDLLAVTVLLSASPLGVNAYLIATQIKQYQTSLAGTLVLSTLVSVASFSFWLSVLL